MASPTQPQEATTRPPALVLGRRILEARLDAEADRLPGHRLVLVHGRYEPGAPTQFPVLVGAGEKAVTRRVTVIEQNSVLGIADSWHTHEAAASAPEAANGERLLVVVTQVPEAALGWDLLGYAVRNRVLSVDRAEIVQRRCGAARLDPRIRTEPWLVDALLDAEPRDGWPQVGGVLTRDTAMRFLVQARLGLDASDRAAETPPDADALLAWSRTAGGPDRFAALDEAERTEITEWLVSVAGAAVRPLLDLAASRRAQDAMPLGVVASAMNGPSGSASAETAMTIGALFGQRRVDLGNLQAFTTAVEGTLTRWLADARGFGQHRTRLNDQAMDVLHRADALAGEAGLTSALVSSAYLPSAFENRMAALGSALRGASRDAEHALDRVKEHWLAPLRASRVRTAEAAVRLLRRLEQPAPAPGSAADGLQRHLADWGWMDAALTVLWPGDPDADAALAAAYQDVCDRAVQARAEADEVFAERLSGWARTAHTLAPGGCLLVEDVLAEVAAPLRKKDKHGETAPLVLLVDGMSSAVATGLAQELAARSGWVEAGRRKDVRDAAAAVIPSVTRLSRSSLLAGKLTAGGQSVEKEGFAAFWAGRKDPDAVLFHKAEIAGTAGKRLSDELQYALAGKSAVGVVLNTVDDSLDKAAQGDRTGWRIADVTFLDELLGAARSYGRPVVIVSDHGHVLERGDLDSAPSPTGRNEASAARWRTGTAAGDGEMLLSGPRVLEGDGPEGNRRVVVPWREDIRYTQRKGGYHGGASLAEMTVPVLVFLPSSELLPAGWSLLAPERVTPTWWETQRLGAAGSDGGRMPAAGAPAPTEVDAQPAVSGVRAQHGPRASQAVGTGSSQRAVHGSGRADSSSAPATPTGGPSVAGQGEGASAGPLGTAAQHPAAADGKSGAPHSSSPSLGSKIVESAVFREQRKFVRRGPKSPQVSAAIDALAAADGTLSTTGVAAAAGFPPARAGGLMVMLQRLLNVEGYPVLEFVDGGARLKLNTGLARQQFQVDAE